MLIYTILPDKEVLAFKQWRIRFLFTAGVPFILFLYKCTFIRSPVPFALHREYLVTVPENICLMCLVEYLLFGVALIYTSTDLHREQLRAVGSTIVGHDIRKGTRKPRLNNTLFYKY